MQLYNSFIYPYLNYCIAVWGSTCHSYLLPLIKLQKRVVRMISGAQRYDHTEPIFKALGILKIKEIYVYSIQCLLYKFHHQLLPDVFSTFFTINSNMHSYATRQANLLHVPLKKCKQASIFVRKNGVRSSNYFCNIIDLNCSICCYKGLVKRHILENGVSFINL